MKKILLFFITVLALVSCDPESVFIESQAYGGEYPYSGAVEKKFIQKTIYKDDDIHARKEIKSITYNGHEYLLVFYANGYGVDVEMMEISAGDKKEEEND